MKRVWKVSFPSWSTRVELLLLFYFLAFLWTSIQTYTKTYSNWIEWSKQKTKKKNTNTHTSNSCDCGNVFRKWNGTERKGKQINDFLTEGSNKKRAHTGYKWRRFLFSGAPIENQQQPSFWWVSFFSLSLYFSAVINKW